jgi:hypothetical protein
LALFETFENLGQTLAKKITRPIKVVWMNKKYSYLCEGRKVKFEYHDGYSKISS